MYKYIVGIEQVNDGHRNKQNATNEASDVPSSKSIVGELLGMALGATVVGLGVGDLGDAVGCCVVGRNVGLRVGASVIQAPQTPQSRSIKPGTSGSGTQMVSSAMINVRQKTTPYRPSGRRQRPGISSSSVSLRPQTSTMPVGEELGVCEGTMVGDDVGAKLTVGDALGITLEVGVAVGG